MIKGEHVLYGLSGHKEIVDSIVDRLKTLQDDFGIRLILTEALTNAFNHGNKSDPEKPIVLRYMADERMLRIEVTDSGCGFKNLHIPERISDESVLDEKGRGLFLISCYSDKVDFKDSTLTIEKDFSYVSLG